MPAVAMRTAVMLRFFVILFMLAMAFAISFTAAMIFGLGLKGKNCEKQDEGSNR
jgi:hypothetical protein